MAHLYITLFHEQSALWDALYSSLALMDSACHYLGEFTGGRFVAEIFSTVNQISLNNSPMQEGTSLDLVELIFHGLRRVEVKLNAEIL